MTNPKTVFVLGASGLVGQEVCLNYLDKGHRVYGFSRSEPVDNILEKKNFYFNRLDITKSNTLFFDLLMKIEPEILIITAANHESVESYASSENLIKIHLQFLNEFAEKAKQIHWKISVIFCSSIMAYIPDRKYPSYAASKAGLNQYIQSLQLTLGSNFTLKSIVLGPITATPNSFFERKPITVASKIYNLSLNDSKGVIFYPTLGKPLALFSVLFPYFIENLTFKYRKQ